MNKKTHQVKGESCIQKTHLSLQLVYHGLCIPPKRISQFWKKNRSRRTLPSDNHSLQCRFVPYHILARLALEMAPNRRLWPFLNENIFSHSAMRPPKSTVDSPNIFACFSSNWSKDSLKKTSRKFSTFSNARVIQKFNRSFTPKAEFVLTILVIPYMLIRSLHSTLHMFTVNSCFYYSLCTLKQVNFGNLSVFLADNQSRARLVESNISYVFKFYLIYSDKTWKIVNRDSFIVCNCQ